MQPTKYKFLPNAQGRAKRAPGLGVNTKNLFALKSRFWQNFASSPTLTDSNGLADMTWETTEDVKIKINNQPDFALVAFSGADHSQELVDLASDQAREAALRNQLTSVYPGIEAQIKKSKFMDWPGKHFARFLLFPRSERSHHLGPLLENWLFRLASFRGRTYLLRFHGLHGRGA